MLRVLSLYLAITIALFSGLQGHAGVPMIICAGGSVGMVMIDEDGAPIEHQVPCEECCITTFADLPSFLVAPRIHDAARSIALPIHAAQRAGALQRTAEARAPPLG